MTPTIAVWVDGVVILGLLALCLFLVSTCKEYSKILHRALDDIHEYVLAATAFQASQQVHPTTGPAVLQRLKDLKDASQVDKVAEEVKKGLEKKEDRPGISIREGAI